MTKINFLIVVCYFLCLNFGTAQEKQYIYDLPLPKTGDFVRTQTQQGTFAHFVQQLPIRQNTKSVKSVSGQIPYEDMLAVVDLPMLFPTQDLEQCADWAMRLWAEYHQSQDKLSELYLLNYGGKHIYFNKQNRSYRKFLHWAFAYSNSHSLKQGLQVITQEELSVGDLLVQNETGGIGHVSVVLDKCQNKEGKTLYRIGFSYMPAQEMRIITPLEESYGQEGWFTYEGIVLALQVFYVSGEVKLRRF